MRFWAERRAMRGWPAASVLLAVVAGGLIGPSATAASAKASASYPAEIQKLVSESASLCRRLTGKPGSAGDMVRRLDVNGDGLADYLVYSGEYRCPGRDSAFGPGASYGVPAYLFLGRSKGRLRQVWTDNSWVPKITGRGRRTTITIPMRGRICGDTRGNEISIAEWYSCDLKLRPDAQGRWGLHDRTMK